MTDKTLQVLEPANMVERLSAGFFEVNQANDFGILVQSRDAGLRRADKDMVRVKAIVGKPLVV